MLCRPSVLFALLLVSLPCRAQVPVDVELSLLVDTSGSISDDEYRLQIDAYADLVADPAVIPQDGSIALNLVLFASDAQEAVPWALVDSEAAALALSNAIRATPRRTGATALGDGLIVASETFAANAFEGARRVIDVSGDGRVNSGTGIQQARAHALALVDTVNGLAITAEDADLGDYFRDEVIGGEGAFAFEVVDAATFGDALRAKLLRETRGCLPPPPGVIGWWPLDETAGPLSCDASGARQGVHAGCPRPVPGIVGGALSFDGIDDAVRVPAMEAALGDAASVIAWIRSGAAGSQALVELHDAASGAGILLVLRDGVAHGVIVGGAGTFEIGGGAPLADDAWHLVALVAGSGPGALRLVVDGSLVAAADLPAGATLPSGGAVSLGEATLIPLSRFTGVLDEVQVAGRMVSDAELAAIASAGPVGQCRWAPTCASASGPGLLAEGCLWPPNHRYACFTDLAALAPQLAEAGAGGVRVLSCTSSQPENERGTGDGDTVEDCVVLPDGSGFCLRSEREGTDRAGRAYTLEVGATDGCGATILGTIRMSVPHDRREHGDCLPADPHRFLLPWEALPGSGIRPAPRPARPRASR